MTCCWKHCKAEGALTWLGHALCWRHWEKVCELTDTMPAEEVRRKYTRSKRDE
jgi:hypothetical protein